MALRVDANKGRGGAGNLVEENVIHTSTLPEITVSDMSPVFEVNATISL